MANEQRNLYPGKRAICSHCGAERVAVIIAPNNQFYCLRCLRRDYAILYLQLVHYVHDHPPQKP